MPESSAEIKRLLAVVDVQNELAAAALDVEGIMATVVRKAVELTDADAGVVEMAEGEEMVYRAVAGKAEGYAGTRLDIASSLSGRAVLEGRVLICDDCEQDDRVDRDAARRVGAVSMVCVPLVVLDAPIGVLKVYSGHAHAFGEGEVAILGQLSATIAAHIRRAEEFEREAFDSRHDPLTLLANRRAYMERLEKEVARAVRYEQVLSVVLLDLDRFKQVNDTAGHPAGDEVLRKVATAMRGTRAADDCFRIGGDEFAVVLPHTPGPGAFVVADRIAAAIAEENRDTGVTAGYGIATYQGGTAADLHEQADDALVAAKDGAR